MVDEAGNVIATLYDQNRVNVPLSQISRKMVKAIVAIEDYRFYQHGALDLKGTLRALITNQANSGVVQGGSSITQQMVKMTLLAQAKGNKKKAAEATDDTYARKVRELRYAIAFEQHYSKDWILERYLNLAYFGDGAYGIQSAARHYFDVNAKRPQPGASPPLLAGLVKNPTGYDPTNYPDRALERRDVVLDRMAQLSVITDAKADQLKKRGLGLDVVKTQQRLRLLAGAVLLRLRRSTGSTTTSRSARPSQDRKELINSGGLTIHTTIDLRDQDAADKSVADHVHPTDQAIGGLAMVEPRTGDVKALAQSRPMGRDQRQGRDLPQLRRARSGTATPTGSRPGRRSRPSCWRRRSRRASRSTPRSTRRSRCTSRCRSYPTCGGHNFYSTDVWEPAELHRRRHVQPLHRHPAVGEHLLRPARGADRPVRALPAGQGDGHRPHRPQPRARPVVHPRRRRDQPAGDGRGLRDVRRPRPALRLPPGDLDRGRRRQRAQGLPGGLPAGDRRRPTADAVNDILRGVQEPGGFGYDAGISLDQPSAGKTGTINEQHGGVVRRLHPDPGHRRR